MQLQMLSAEETVVELHCQTAPKSHKLRLLRVWLWDTPRPKWIASLRLKCLLAVFALCVLLGLLGVLSNLDFSRAVAVPLAGIAIFFLLTWVLLPLLVPLIKIIKFVERIWNARPLQQISQLTYILSSTLENCISSAICPELVDFIGWLETAPPHHTRLLKTTLARLLPKVGEDELRRSLNNKRRKTLRRLLQHPDTPRELMVATLLALGSVRDRKTLPLAYKLKNSDMSDAAEAFLDVMRTQP